MGCDIHPWVQVKVNDKWVDFGTPERLRDRTYGRFAFLTGGVVRNYSEVPSVLPKPKGLPDGREDSATWDSHSGSWLSLEELLKVDYNIVFRNKREAGQPEMTLAEFLGPTWFEIMDELASYGLPSEVRIVFDFDN